jgi:hypothetical protein
VDSLTLVVSGMALSYVGANMAARFDAYVTSWKEIILTSAVLVLGAGLFLTGTLRALFA